mmetsp:Transcript_125388/g.360231  ORF Transcript_125388/g.360231 Transcript_125388/m.360231 type:complete len:233 (+) Transcript_125388:97-795(+)
MGDEVARLTGAAANWLNKSDRPQWSDLDDAGEDQAAAASSSSAARGASSTSTQSASTSNPGQAASGGRTSARARAGRGRAQHSSAASSASSSRGSSDQTSDTSTGSKTSQGQWPSVGSQLHPSGKCRPCMFSHTPAGCSNGAACQYCHCSHRRQRAIRPNKAKRDRFKALADRQAREAGLLPDGAGSDDDIAGRAGDEPAEDNAGDQDWTELIEDEAFPVRRNKSGKKILHL